MGRLRGYCRKLQCCRKTILKGLCLKAQGCQELATLGRLGPEVDQLQRSCVIRSTKNNLCRNHYLLSTSIWFFLLKNVALSCVNRSFAALFFRTWEGLQAAKLSPVNRRRSRRSRPSTLPFWPNNYTGGLGKRNQTRFQLVD